MSTCCVCFEYKESSQLSDIKCKSCNWECCQDCMNNYLEHKYTQCFSCDFEIVNKRKSIDFVNKNTFDCWFQQGRVPLPNYCPCSNCLEDEW